MFQLDQSEFDNLISQFATSSSGWGGRRKLPYAFTEHGAIMAANVLSSPMAIEVSVYVVRAFVKLRQSLMMLAQRDNKLAELEKKIDSHDKAIRSLLIAIQKLMELPDKNGKKAIGFKAK